MKAIKRIFKTKWMKHTMNQGVEKGTWAIGKNKFAAVCIFATTLFPSLSLAAFHCIPSMRSTWILVEQKNQKVYVSVRNPMGYEYMPQMDGPLSAATLPFQRMQFDDLTELGSEFTMIWPQEKCRLDKAAQTVFCSGDSESAIGSIKPLSLSTIKISEDHDGTVYTKNRYRISFEKEGNFYFSSIDFFKSTCKTSN